MELRAKAIDIDGDHVAIVSARDAEKLGIVSSKRARIVRGERTVYVRVMVSKSLVPEGWIGLSPSTMEALRIEEGDRVYLQLPRTPSSLNAIKKRLRGERLADDEIYELIQDVVSGALDEAEIAAFLASQIAIPLSNEELTALIRAMATSGHVIEWGEPAYDEHSIGGVPGNSKVAMLAVPIVAYTGLLIPKTSSRAITSPSGTADTMEVLASVDLSPSEIVSIAKKVRGVLVWGGALNIAIADDVFVEIERKLMLDPQTQMVASILSKKVAMSITGLVIDIPVGRGAKIQSHSDADRVAGLFIGQCGRLGINVKVVLTFGGEPIGRTVGPALEAAEALRTLMSGKGSHSLVDKAVAIAGQVLEIAGRVEPGKGEIVARQILETGRAYAKMREIIEAQGGDPKVEPEDLPIGGYRYTFTSPIEGAVTSIDNKAISLIARAAGAPKDKGAGVYFHAKIGHRVRRGDPLFTIYSSSEARLEEAIKLAELYKPVLVEGMVLKLLP